MNTIDKNIRIKQIARDIARIESEKAMACCYSTPYKEQLTLELLNSQLDRLHHEYVKLNQD